MKLNAALAKSLLLAASVGLAGPLSADTTVTPTPPSPAPAKPPAKTPPAKPTKPANAKPAKPQPAPPAAKAENPEDIKLPGIVETRPGGGFLTVEVEGGKLKVSFYDAKKKAIPADVARASAHWRSNRKIMEEHTVLSPSGDGKSLVSAGLARAPYVYIVYLTLLSEEGTAVESYNVDMKALGGGGADAAADGADSKM